jgi:FHS family glucose/mannose:H+ symporter-like MFS transporter
MQNKPNHLTVSLLTAGCFLAFFIFGFTDNLKGPTLPAMIEELKIDYGTGGNIFFSLYFGFLVATLITGILADRFGLKMVILLASICLAFGVGGYSSFSSTSLLGLSLFIVGMGLGGFELGPNALIVSLYHERKGLYLNLMAVLHGLGSLAAPLFAGWLFSMDISWRTVYRWDLLLILVFILLTIFLRFPRAEETSQLEFRQIPRIAFKGPLPWFYTAIALYVSIEIGMASWLVTFLQDVRGMSVATSNRSLALFFAMIMIGRLLGGFFVQRAGYLRSILLVSLGALICMVIGLYGPSIFLALTGLFLSIIFPTITAAVSDMYTENINTILGVLFTFAGLGGLMGPWVIGMVSDYLGLQTGFSLTNLAFALLTSGSIFILLQGISNGKTT